MRPEFETIKIITEGPIGHLILNRPEKSNAINQKMMAELLEAIQWFNCQKHIRTVILKGEGKAFSAGADLSSFANFAANFTWQDQRDNALAGKYMIDAIANMKAISIAQVHGFAIGGALLMVLACDFRYATSDTFFSIPEVDIGIPLAWGGIPRMVREFGPLRTKELVMTCRKFSAQEAKNWGMLNAIVSAEEITIHCSNLAIQLASKPMVPIRITKEHVNSVSDSIGNWSNQNADAEALMAAMGTSEFKQIATDYLSRMSSRKEF